MGFRVIMAIVPPPLAQASEADMQAVMASLVDRFDAYDTVIQAELQAGRGYQDGDQLGNGFGCSSGYSKGGSAPLT